MRIRVLTLVLAAQMLLSAPLRAQTPPGPGAPAPPPRPVVQPKVNSAEWEMRLLRERVDALEKALAILSTQAVVMSGYAGLPIDSVANKNVTLHSLDVTVTQKATLVIRFEGHVNLTACTGAGCTPGGVTFMTGTVNLNLARASGGGIATTHTDYGTSISGGISEQSGRKIATGTTVSLPIGLTLVKTGVAPGTYRALADLYVPGQSAAHRFSPRQIIVEVFPEL